MNQMRHHLLSTELLRRRFYTSEVEWQYTAMSAFGGKADIPHKNVRRVATTQHHVRRHYRREAE